MKQEPKPFKAGEIKIGDYINYKPVAGKKVTVGKEETGYDEEQTYEVDTKTTWRVLGLSENENNLLLISGSPILKKEKGATSRAGVHVYTPDGPYLVLQGAEGYYNCEDVLDKVSGIYQNSLAQQVKSVRMEDITRTLGITIDKDNNKAYKTADANKTELPYEGFFGQTYTYKSGDYAPENYLKATYPSNSKYQNFTNKKVGNKVNGTSYMIPYPVLVEQGSTICDLLFNVTTESIDSDKSYWLASPGVYFSDGNAIFGPGAVLEHEGVAITGFDLFFSVGAYRPFGLGVCPVVTLKSEVTIDDLTIINGSEADGDTFLELDSRDIEGTTGQVEE